MTVEEYGKEVQELLKNANGYINGVKLSKDINIRTNVVQVNGNPALIFCETDDNLKPTKVVYCLEFADVQTARAFQIWIADIMGILAHEGLQKSDMSEVLDITNTKMSNPEA